MADHQKNNYIIPISVFIICKNEEDRIGASIKSVTGWTDEIIVVDSGSTDKTVEIAQKAGATKVVFNEWKGYGPQKNFAQGLCKNHWVFNLDADEEVTDSLKEEIIDLFKSGKIDNHSTYDIAIKIAPRFIEFNESSKGPEKYCKKTI